MQTFSTDETLDSTKGKMKVCFPIRATHNSNEPESECWKLIKRVVLLSI